MAFLKSPLLVKMTGRYMKGVQLTEDQLFQMRIMMRRMMYILSIHTLLIIYSAFFMSTAAWGFISGGLFYVLLGLFLGYEFLRARYKKKKIMEKFEAEEWFDIVTSKGEIVGKAPRSAVHGNPELIHSVVHVHILNSKGDLYLQKRAPTKKLYPGRWDTAVGGHVSSGETVEHALVRESEEELGLSMVEFTPLFRYVYRNEYESELVHGFWIRDEGPFFINRQEISEGKFWTISEIRNNLGKQIYTPNFEEEFELLNKILFPKIH
jgi:isopentenyldiphosphate isomerase